MEVPVPNLNSYWVLFSFQSFFMSCEFCIFTLAISKCYGKMWVLFFQRDNSLVSARKSHSSGVRGLVVRCLLFNPAGSCSNPRVCANFLQVFRSRRFSLFRHYETPPFFGFVRLFSKNFQCPQRVLPSICYFVDILQQNGCLKISKGPSLQFLGIVRNFKINSFCLRLGLALYIRILFFFERPAFFLCYFFSSLFSSKPPSIFTRNETFCLRAWRTYRKSSSKNFAFFCFFLLFPVGGEWNVFEIYAYPFGYFLALENWWNFNNVLLHLVLRMILLIWFSSKVRNFLRKYLRSTASPLCCEKWFYQNKQHDTVPNSVSPLRFCEQKLLCFSGKIFRRCQKRSLPLTPDGAACWGQARWCWPRPSCSTSSAATGGSRENWNSNSESSLITCQLSTPAGFGVLYNFENHRYLICCWLFQPLAFATFRGF